MPGQDTEPLIYCYKRWFFKSTNIQDTRPASCEEAKEAAKEGFAHIGIWLPPNDSVNIYYLMKNKTKVYVTAKNWSPDSFKGTILYLEPRSNLAHLKQVLRNFFSPPKPKEGDGGDGSKKGDGKDNNGGADLKDGREPAMGR